MPRMLKLLTLGMALIGLAAGFYLIPTDRVNSEPGDSPLYNASLSSTTNYLMGQGDTGRQSDGKGGGTGNLITCEVTCGPTCNQTTCGSTCVSTCSQTCANTCNQTTCSSTCVSTCAYTCANTCEQATCASTCVWTCDYTCEEPISLVSFNARAGQDEVVISWTTGSEVDNYRFVIWRSNSADGNFAAIADLQATGGVATTNYNYTDANVNAGVTYYYRLSDISIYGYETVHEMVVSATPGASLGLAADFRLEQNYPNPFNPETTIRFSVPQTAQTVLAVFDMSGRQVATLVNGSLSAGYHQAVWNASDMTSGLYIYRLTSGDLTASGKMILTK